MKHAALLLALSALFPVFASPDGKALPCQIPPVHRLVPRDVEGARVSPSESLPAPFSQTATCGQCHDVAALHGGTHFRTGLDTNDAPAAVQTEPWFWADDALGLAIPLSLHGQPGAFAPADLGLSAFEWTRLFGRHFPGGGPADDPRAMAEAAGDRQRWFVTGPLEANCLACHQQGDGYDPSEWARQVARENFTGAAVAASGLGQVEGMNARMPAAWAAKENPDDHLFNVPQKVVYDPAKFDAKGRCVFPVGKPTDARCQACHAAAPAAPPRAHAGDVHLARGLHCTDCHRNGMDHRLETTSCRTCHIAPQGTGPLPQHAGIPLVHFAKLSCTVCHSSGRDAIHCVRTARANRIGLYGRAQWDTDVPRITEPVFIRGADGKIAPHRVVWPAYFAAVDADGAVKPLRLDAVKDLKALVGVTNGLTRAIVAAALRELDATDAINCVPPVPPNSTDAINCVPPVPSNAINPMSSGGTQFIASPAASRHAFIGHGKMWTRAEDGTNLTAAAHAAAAMIAWPVAHDVRPARQARGAAPAKCADCHTGGSDFFQARIYPDGPMADAEAEPVAQADLMGLSGAYHAVLGTTFAMRPLLKTFLWTVFGLMCLFAAAAGAVALNRVAGWIEENTVEFLWGAAKWAVDAGFVVCTAYLAASGVAGWLTGGMTGVWLVLHMCAGGGFAACAAAILAVRLRERTRTARAAAVWLTWTVLAAGTVFTAVMPMMTVFGGAGQEALLWSHRLVALAFVAASAAVCRSCVRRRTEA